MSLERYSSDSSLGSINSHNYSSPKEIISVEPRNYRNVSIMERSGSAGELHTLFGVGISLLALGIYVGRRFKSLRN